MLQLLSVVQGLEEAVMVFSATTVVYGAGCQEGRDGSMLQLLFVVQDVKEAVMVQCYNCCLWCRL